MIKQECQACGIIVTGFPLTCPHCGRDAGFRLLDAMTKDDTVIPIRIVLGINTTMATVQGLDFVARQSAKKHESSLKFMAKLAERAIDQAHQNGSTSCVMNLELAKKRLAQIMEAMAVNARYDRTNGYIIILTNLTKNYCLAHT